MIGGSYASVATRAVHRIFGSHGVCRVRCDVSLGTEITHRSFCAGRQIINQGWRQTPTRFPLHRLRAIPFVNQFRLSVGAIQHVKRKRPSGRFQRVAGCVIVGLGLGCLDEGFRRCIQFWALVLPLYMHYIWVDKVSHRKDGPNGEDARNAEFDRLHTRYSPIVKRATLHFRGFYLKAAQLISMRDDYVPQIYLDWVRALQDEVPMMLSSQEAREVIANELKLGPRGVDEILVDWVDEPIGSASIGQVYKARLKSTEEWVAIKVQVPGAERLFRADIQCLKLFTYFVLPWAYENMVEIEKAFRAEFDYGEEMRNLQALREQILPTWSKKVYLPRPIPEICSRRVLGMELLRGENLVTAVKRRLGPIAAREGKTVEDFARERQEALLSGRYKPESVRSISWKMALWRWRQRLFGRGPDEEEPLDLGDIYATLLAIQGQAVLRDGFFNADPHPGNVLLLEDGKTLGLVDFGQAISIPLGLRLKLARLVLALAKRNPQEVARLERDIGVQRRHYKEDVQYRMCSFWLDRDTDDVMQGMNLFDFLLWGDLEDGVVSQPEGYYMVCRSSLILRSSALVFGVRVVASDYWASYAEALLREHGELT
eukprot:TRINITY_DN76269_c0_g1_i1.p1 TRINITY_DN76269_c0_g1~~TRINITY_DN76269_c0_g1_i1.p1  ORF type:complete len:599 (-),score=76.21 TRINITY_DN76269_c0_g1_i1:232-2028(-)